MGTAKNFYAIDLDELEALLPGARVLLDAGVAGQVVEHLHRSRQLRVRPDADPSRPLLVTYDAVEQILSR